MKPIAFKSNAGRMGFRELFRVAGSPGVGLFACTLKLFRVLGPDSDGYGMRSFGDDLMRLEMDSLPRRVLKDTANYREKVEKLGFVPGFAYSLETFGMQEAHGQVFRHRDGLSAVSIAYARCVRAAAETVTTVVGFNTPLVDDTYVMTSNSKRLMCKPESFLTENMPGRSPKEVYERQMERVESSSVSPRKIRNDDDLENLVLNCENEETAFNMERGVYVRMTRAEIELGKELKEEYVSSDGKGRKRSQEEEDYEDE